MDAGRFDALSRSFANRRSRRAALQGLGAGGLAAGLLGALGVERAPAASGACELTIFAKTAAGPHKNTTYSGTLHLEIGENGAIDQGAFTTTDGASRLLVGQATGRALNLRITLGPNKILALDGTADNDLILCRGAASGAFSGPGDTDIGAWRTGSGGTSSSAKASGSGSATGASSSGGATGFGGGTTTDGGGATSGNTSDNTGGGGSNGGGDGGSTGGANENGCPAGQQLCDGQCVDLQTNLDHCGHCGFFCASGLVCTDGVCLDPGCGADPTTGTALVLCTGICVNTDTDPNNCGACDNVCPGGPDATCRDGACACLPDGASCANTYSYNCCSNKCPPSGVCGCVPPAGACNNTGECCLQAGGGCVNGLCAYTSGFACTLDAECISGKCVNGVCT